MFGTPKTVIGLDVGSYAIKAVALQPNRDRLTLVGCAQARIGTSEPGEVIRKVIEQLGVRPKRVATSVSGRSVIVRQVETPRLAADELKAHIIYEADKYIPFGAEEVIIDCQPLPELGEARAANMQVLLVAVRRGFVEDHVTQLRAAGIQSEIVDVDVFALANAYELLGPGAQADEDSQKATALIDIGASKSNIAIVQGNRVLFTREIYQAGNEITDAIVRTFNEAPEDIERIKSNPGETIEALIDAAMPAFEDLANEIRLSFDYVEGQFETVVGDVVLSGGSSQLAGISGILGNILGRPVRVFDPLAGLDLVPSRYDIHTLDANSPSLTVALGLASHLLQDPTVGLGSANSQGWQPRNARNSVAVPSLAGNQPIMPEPGAPMDVDPVASLPDDEVQPEVKPQFAPMPPPAATFPTPPMMMMPPPSPMPPPRQMESPAAGTSDVNSASSEDLLADSRQSGLLVVLDEDQEMPPSERFGKPTIRTPAVLQALDEEQQRQDQLQAAVRDTAPHEALPEPGAILAFGKPGGDAPQAPVKLPSTILKVEGFAEDDDEGKDQDLGLPQLPKL